MQRGTPTIVILICRELRVCRNDTELFLPGEDLFAQLVPSLVELAFVLIDFSPDAASFSAVGVRQGPPKALDEPNPAPSIRTSRTLGAPLGGRSCLMGGYFAAGSFASL